MTRRVDLCGVTDLVAIYALCEPDTGEVRYVGKADNPEQRLDTHLRQAATVALRTHKGRWIAKLKASGTVPHLQVLEWVPREGWQDVERYWIKQMRAFGCDLTNGTDGGDGGAIAAAQTPEARAKRTASRRGQQHTPETRAKLSEKARQRDPSVYANCSPPPVRHGAANNKAKLTDELVVDLRHFVRDGGTAAEWARAHGVTPAAASYAARGDTWRHVDAPTTPKVRKQRLSDEDVFEMRQLAALGESQSAIARRFGTSQSYVSQVVNQLRRDGAVQGGQ